MRHLLISIIFCLAVEKSLSYGLIPIFQTDYLAGVKRPAFDMGPTQIINNSNNLVTVIDNTDIYGTRYPVYMKPASKQTLPYYATSQTSSNNIRYSDKNFGQDPNKQDILNLINSPNQNGKTVGGTYNNYYNS